MTELLFIDHSIVSRWESGRLIPTKAEMNEIADKLGLAEDEQASLIVAFEQEVVRRNALASDVLMTTRQFLDRARQDLQTLHNLRLAGLPRPAVMFS